jgi:hypothetical protein
MPRICAIVSVLKPGKLAHLMLKLNGMPIWTKSCVGSMVRMGETKHTSKRVARVSL